MRKKFIKATFCLLLVIIFTAVLYALTFHGWGYKATDGDSVVIILNNKKKVVVELEGIDCPELQQDCGNEAMEFTKAFIYKKKVRVDIKDYNNEDVFVGRLFVDGQDLSLALIEEGLAWYDKKNSSDKTLGKAQKKAKKAKKGLWKKTNPTPPWTFRNTSKLTEKE